MKRKIELPESIEEFYGARLADVTRVVACAGNLLKVYFADRSVEYWQDGRRLSRC